MASSLDPLSFWVKVITFCATIPLNVFILMENILDWTKKKSLNESDLLTSGAAFLSLLTEILRMVVLLFGFSLKEGFLWIQLSKGLELGNMWFCTWLSVNFCLRIVNFNHRFYISLQRKFQKHLPCLLFLTVLSCFLMIVPPLWEISLSLHSNTSSHAKYQDVSFSIFATVFCAPFALFFISLLSIISYLCRHIMQMRNGETRPNLMAHVRATQSLTALLALYTLYFIASLIWSLFRVMYTFALLVVSFRSLLSPILLINGNGKLRKRFKHHCIYALSGCGSKK